MTKADVHATTTMLAIAALLCSATAGSLDNGSGSGFATGLDNGSGSGFATGLGASATASGDPIPAHSVSGRSLQ